MKRVLALSVLLLGIASPAIAGWKKVETNVAGDTYYFDSQRVVKLGDRVQFSYKVVKAYPDQGVKSLVIRVEGNCSYNQVKNLEAKVYNQRGKLLATQPMDGLVRYVLQGSYEGFFLSQSCTL